jgi:hypothetical protein
MTDSGKGKEREVVEESSAATPTPTDVLPSDATASPVPATFADTVEAPASAGQAELPSETTEGPSESAQQINPHVSVVSSASQLSNHNKFLSAIPF